MRVHLDFETRSELDVKKVGAAVYAAHPSTEILCIGFLWCDSFLETFEQVQRHEIEAWDLFGVEHGVLNELASNPKIEFAAHNAYFEQCIWREIMVGRYGFSPIALERWVCTAAKAAYYALPRDLERASRVLKLDVVKDKEGNRVMQDLAKPRSRTSKANPDKYWEPDKVPDKFKVLYSYNKTDVLTEVELDNTLPDLRPTERRIWLADQRMNHYGIAVDVPAVHRAIDYLERCKAELTQQLEELTNGQTTRNKFLKFLQDNSVTIWDLQAATVEKLIRHLKSDATTSKTLLDAVIIYQKLSRTSTAKYAAIIKRLGHDGRLRDILMYYGAPRTGRWAGRGVQLHNMVRPNCDIYETVDDLMTYDYEFFSFLHSVMDVIAEIIRGMLIASKGMELYTADFSAIEARVNAWLSEEDELLNDFREGRCNYCSLASDIYGHEVNKHDHPNQRQVGKVGELALGYEGGINAFATMAITYRLDLSPAYPHIWATTTSDERERAEKAYARYVHTQEEPVCKEFGLAADIIKQRYRAKRTRIKTFWSEAQEAAIECLLTGLPVKCGKVTFFTNGPKVISEKVKSLHKGPAVPYIVEGKSYVATSKNGCFEFDRYFMHIKLPSGRCLSYHKPSLTMSKTPWGKKAHKVKYWGLDDRKQYVELDTYGGKLVENIVQAVARDLLAESFLRIEAAGFKPVLQVHDEVVAEAPIGFCTLEDYEALMSVLPDWAEGLPLKAEGWIGPRYRK